MRMITVSACVLSALLIASTHAQGPLPANAWRTDDAPQELREPLSRADLIVVSMQDALLRELTNALEEGGPAFAVNSCHVDVAGIIQRVARREGVAAGRTADRLRNPGNAPRPWAAPLVAAHAGRQARQIDGFVVDLGRSVGVLRPIAHQPMCASCHGSSRDIDPEVREALRIRYPIDRATGFEVGEIRGWFWVEVPKQRR